MLREVLEISKAKVWQGVLRDFVDSRPCYFLGVLPTFVWFVPFHILDGKWSKSCSVDANE